MNDRRSKLLALPLLLVASLLFAGYIGNILMGTLAIQHGVNVPYFPDLWEFLMLFGASIGFIVFILLNEEKAS